MMAIDTTRLRLNLLKTRSAEVIKIEHPTRGDDTRAWGPPYATYNEESGKQGPGESAYFLAVGIYSSSDHSYSDIHPGESQQEIIGPVVCPRFRCTDSAQVGKGMRCTSRELLARCPQEVWHGLRDSLKDQPWPHLCEYHWIRPDWTVEEEGRL